MFYLLFSITFAWVAFFRITKFIQINQSLDEYWFTDCFAE